LLKGKFSGEIKCPKCGMIVKNTGTDPEIPGADILVMKKAGRYSVQYDWEKELIGELDRGR
jgi:hypothetical protein